MDEDHMKTFQKAGQNETTFNEYLDEYVFQVRDHEAYLDKVGITGLLSRLKYY